MPNGPPRYRQQLYMVGGIEKQDWGRDDSRSYSFSGPHEALRHHSHTSSTGQQVLHFIQGRNPTFVDELPTGPAWQTPEQPFIKGNTNVEIPLHRSHVWNGSIISHTFVVPTDLPSRKTNIITASSILKSKCICICQPPRSPWLQF